MISTTACVTTVLPPVSLRLRVREPSNDKTVNESEYNRNNMNNNYNSSNNHGNMTKASPSLSPPRPHRQALWVSIKPPFPPSRTKKRRSKAALSSAQPRSLLRSENNGSSTAKMLTNSTPTTLKKRITIDVEALTYYPAVESTFDPHHETVAVDFDGSKSEHHSDIENNCKNINNDIVRKTSRKRLRRLSELVHDQDENLNNENSSVRLAQSKMGPRVEIHSAIRPSMEINRDGQRQYDSKTYSNEKNSINRIEYNQNLSPSRNEDVDANHDAQPNQAIPYKKRAMFGITQAQNVLTTSISSQGNA